MAQQSYCCDEVLVLPDAVSVRDCHDRQANQDESDTHHEKLEPIGRVVYHQDTEAKKAKGARRTCQHNEDKPPKCQKSRKHWISPVNSRGDTIKNYIKIKLFNEARFL